MSDQVFFQRDDGWTDEGWTSVPNRVLRDFSLSLEARGLFAYLASHSSNFEISQESLARACGPNCGRDRLRRVMNELLEAGYVERHQAVLEGGRLGHWCYVLHSRRSEPATENPSPVEPLTVEPSTANPTPYKKNTSKKTNLEEDQGELALDAKPVAPPKPPARRGSRIPTDFDVNPDMKTWAIEHTPAIDVAFETANFVDYWIAKPGQAATKLDWVRTWQTWMRRAQNSAGTRGGRAAPQIRKPSPNVRYCEV